MHETGYALSLISPPNAFFTLHLLAREKLLHAASFPPPPPSRLFLALPLMRRRPRCHSGDSHWFPLHDRVLCRCKRGGSSWWHLTDQTSLAAGPLNSPLYRARLEIYGCKRMRCIDCIVGAALPVWTESPFGKIFVKLSLLYVVRYANSYMIRCRCYMIRCSLLPSNGTCKNRAENLKQNIYSKIITIWWNVTFLQFCMVLWREVCLSKRVSVQTHELGYEIQHHAVRFGCTRVLS